jgi:hypothetical protein
MFKTTKLLIRLNAIYPQISNKKSLGDFSGPLFDTTIRKEPLMVINEVPRGPRFL